MTTEDKPREAEPRRFKFRERHLKKEMIDDFDSTSDARNAAASGEEDPVTSQHEPVQQRLKSKSPAEEDDEEDDRSSEKLLQILHHLTDQQKETRDANFLLRSSLVQVLQEEPVDGEQDEEVAKWSHQKNLHLIAGEKQQREDELEKILQLNISQSALQERLHEVEREWQSLLADQQEVAVKVLSRRLGKDASEQEVTSAAKLQQEVEEKVVRQCRENIRLKIDSDALEAKLRDQEVQHFSEARNQVEKLMSNRLQATQLVDHQKEKSSELEKKINASVEVLSNVKEKIHWTQEEILTKQKHLVQLETTLVHQRNLLTQTRQARCRLTQDRVQLKEHLALQENTLVQDYKDTLEDCERLEDSLEKIRSRWAELNPR